MAPPAAVHPVLYAEAMQRSRAGESRASTCDYLAAASLHAFDLLEPSLGSFGIRR